MSEHETEIPLEDPAEKDDTQTDGEEQTDDAGTEADDTTDNQD